MNGAELEVVFRPGRLGASEIIGMSERMPCRSFGKIQVREALYAENTRRNNNGISVLAISLAG